MKMDVKNDNYNMFDLIAYRVKFAHHPRAGATWCVPLAFTASDLQLAFLAGHNLSCTAQAW